MTCHCASLDHDALLHLRGPDALTFLQGQVTCDTRKLTSGTALPGLYCTVQGRVVCDFLLCELAPQHLALRMRREIRATSAALFGKYIVFSKARLDAERDDWQVLACWGTGSGALLRDLFGAIPGARFGAAHGEGFTLVQLDEAGEQFELYLDTTVAGDLPARLRDGALPATESDWRALQVAAGIARIEAATSGEYVPQMLNYDLSGHISFNKGCYTGQEVVARLHYRGKPKRRLYRAEIALADLPGDSRPAPGDPLYGDGGAQAIGNVINCVARGDGVMAMLVSAKSDSLATGLHLLSAAGPALRVEDLPCP